MLRCGDDDACTLASGGDDDLELTHEESENSLTAVPIDRGTCRIQVPVEDARCRRVVSSHPSTSAVVTSQDDVTMVSRGHMVCVAASLLEHSEAKRETARDKCTHSFQRFHVERRFPKIS